MKSLHELLPLIRRRPEMYLGERSLTALWHLINGYKIGFGAGGGKINPSQSLPYDFHDWVAYRLHFRESTSGWRNMILSATRNEAEALNRFFELLDQHNSRTAHVFARLLNLEKTYRVGPEGQERTERYPKSISFVTYTDDPGFFVYSDEPGTPWHDRFYPVMDWFENFHNIKRTELMVIDPVTFARLNT